MERMTRGKFIKLLAFTGIGLTLPGCGQAEPTPPALPSPARSPIVGVENKTTALRKDNQVKIDMLKSKPLMTDNDFYRINQAMAQSPSPFINLIARNLKTMWESEKNPSIFPSWIDETATPFVITYDQDPESFAAKETDYGDNYVFKNIQPNGKETKYPLIKQPVKVGVHLGSPAFSRKEGGLVEGMYLAKEWIHVASLPAIASQMLSVFESIGHKFVLLENGKPLPKEDIPLAGVAVFMNNTRQKGSDLWLLDDGLPTALLGTQIRTLVRLNPALESSRGLIPFFKAANMLDNNPSVNRKLNWLVNEWTSSGSMTSPQDYLEYMLDQEISAFVRELQKKLNP